MGLPSDFVAGRDCPLCGRPGEYSHELQGCLVRECRIGHAPVLLAWPWETVAAYEDRYVTPGEYHEREMERSGRQAFVARDTEYLGTANARLSRLRVAYPLLTSFVDVGCGTGSCVALGRAWGFEAAGIEPNPALVAWGKSMGRTMREGQWRDVWVSPCFTLFDVFEHLTEPDACLAHLRQWLTPDGVLVIEMPEYLAPGDWKRHEKPLEHPVLYSVEAAVDLFERHGFRWDEISRPRGGTLGKVSFYLRKR